MKVLKIAAIVVGVAALAITGVGLAAGAAGLGSALAGGALAVGSALGVSGSLVLGVLVGGLVIGGLSLLEGLIPKPSQGGSQTKWKADPYAGMPYPMGRTLVGGNIVYRRGHGSNNKYETFVTILGVCTAASIDTTFMNKTTVAFDGSGNATGTYRNQIYQRTQLGAYPEPSALTSPVGSPPGWTPAHKLSGLAAVMNTFVYDSSSKNGLTSEPSPAWIGHWVKVWDPRLDSTYPGGSGTCRAYQENTYVWSENPHLHALTWALGRYQNGRRVAGIGLGSTTPSGPVKGVDVASFVEGANLNDARGWKIGGQVVTRPDTLWNSLKLMLQAGGAQPALIGGVITSINRAPRVSLATITRDDIVGKCTFSGTQRRRSRINGIIPSYRSEAHDWELVPANIVQVPAFVALDGDERTQDMTYQLVQDVNQVAQLAAYDIYDAREAGPGTVPLKPWWLNYKVGDCLTFAPEDGLSIKTIVTGRSPEAQTGVVTFTLRGETDGKHPYALGQTGVAPPIASLTYDTGVAAPAAGDWTLSGASLGADGATIPALTIAGACSNPSAEAVLFDYRPYVEGQLADDNWINGGTDLPSITKKVFSAVTPNAAYQVSVRYRVRGVVGVRAILGPVTVGSLGIAGNTQMAIANSFFVGTEPSATANGTITINSGLRRYPDGHADVAVTGATIASGRTAGQVVSIAYDDLARAGGPVTYALYADDIEAHTSPAHPGRHYVGYVVIPTAGSPPASGGGTTPPGGGYCVTADTPVMMADGSSKAAGEIAVGDRLWTRHEVSLEWGNYPVEAVQIVDSDDVWEATIGSKLLRSTGDHLVYTGEWTAMRAIGTKIDGTLPVVKMTVTDAHTYVSNGILSHNLKAGASVEP
jgi:hypothetical protein